MKKIKPNECCDCGSYEHTVPMPIKNRIEGIDYCIAHIVAALNAGNIITVASCCGHGTAIPSIILESGQFFGNDTFLLMLSRKEYEEYIEYCKK